MKAVRLLEYGGQLVFNDVPAPTIARDEILVKIKSTAVNHLDLVEASGTARQILPIDLPWIPGHEFSGIVEQIGSDVEACAPGDTVFGTTTGMGAYAEYVAVKAAAIARKPSNLSFEEAASVPVASQTAWEGLFTHGHLEKGQTILIHGGAGAVGAYAVQLASHAGATVIATASVDDAAYLNSIGASRVIDYREAQFEKVLREKVDVVFDLVGGDTQKRSFLVLKEGGHLVSATQPVSQEETARHRVSGAMMRLAPSGDRLGKIARLLEEGTIRPDVATVYALQDPFRLIEQTLRDRVEAHGGQEIDKDLFLGVGLVSDLDPCGAGVAELPDGNEMYLVVEPESAGYVVLGPTLRLLEVVHPRLPLTFVNLFTHALNRWVRVYDYRDAAERVEQLREWYEGDPEGETVELPDVDGATPKCLRGKWNPLKERFVEQFLGTVRNRRIRALLAGVLALSAASRQAERPKITESVQERLADSNPPVPALVAVFEKHDAIEGCFDEEAQGMLECAPEPNLIVPFLSGDIESVRAAFQTLEVACNVFREGVRLIKLTMELVE